MTAYNTDAERTIPQNAKTRKEHEYGQQPPLFNNECKNKICRGFRKKAIRALRPGTYALSPKTARTYGNLRLQGVIPESLRLLRGVEKGQHPIFLIRFQP